jgi:hypothetical protein
MSKRERARWDKDEEDEEREGNHFLNRHRSKSTEGVGGEDAVDFVPNTLSFDYLCERLADGIALHK